MKVCYTCGEKPPKHLPQCPDRLFQKAIGMKPRIVEVDPLPSSDDSDDDYTAPLHPRLFPLKTSKMKRSFLPLNHGSVPATSENRVAISNQPYLPCRPHRLWIAESICNSFLIESIFIGSMPQFIATGKVPACLFRTGRWPLDSTPDKNSEFGIDLSSWDTIQVTQRFALTVENIAVNCQPFWGALEVFYLLENG